MSQNETLTTMFISSLSCILLEIIFSHTKFLISPYIFILYISLFNLSFPFVLVNSTSHLSLFLILINISKRCITFFGFFYLYVTIPILPISYQSFTLLLILHSSYFFCLVNFFSSFLYTLFLIIVFTISSSLSRLY